MSVAREEWAAALREAYPGLSDAEIAAQAAQDLGATPRTVLYWLEETTSPNLLHVKDFIAQHGMRAISALFSKQLSQKRGVGHD
jgi:hypothetical protein